MDEEPMTVAELVEAFDVAACTECIDLRTEIEPLLDGAPAPAALRRWQ